MTSEDEFEHSEEEEEEEEEEDEQDDGDYDARLLAVTDALAKTEPPGASFASGSHARFPLPGLSVAGVGEVPLPLTEIEAKRLVDKCHLSPYGLVHKEKVVRNTWEQDANEIELRNPAWTTLMSEIVESLRLPLGLGEHTQYDAKLYKMLLYETGGLFAKHRDTEKEVGMFGTLVVVLPGRFEGGQLVVHPPTHASTEAPVNTWDPATMNPFDLKYAAFYGDCEHEVLPVASGYRLCLTYNLVVRPGVTHVPHAGGNRVLYTQLEMALATYFQATKVQTNQPSKRQKVDVKEPRDCRLVAVLDHKYTDTGLSLALLKGRDRVVAAALARFCDESKGLFALFLSRVKYTHTTDGIEEDEDEFSVQLLSPWVPYGASGATKVGNVYVDVMSEVAPAAVFAHVSFDGEDYPDPENMGNEGTRVEQYKTAALILQPRSMGTQPRW